MKPIVLEIWDNYFASEYNADRMKLADCQNKFLYSIGKEGLYINHKQKNVEEVDGKKNITVDDDDFVALSVGRYVAVIRGDKEENKELLHDVLAIYDSGPVAFTEEQRGERTPNKATDFENFVNKELLKIK